MNRNSKEIICSLSFQLRHNIQNYAVASMSARGSYAVTLRRYITSHAGEGTMGMRV